MDPSLYARFEVVRPPLLADEYWESVDSELLRLERSLVAGDDVQVLGDVKCLVEAAAKVVLDINGTPADSSEGFQQVVSYAHELLRGQRGDELAHQSAYAKLALQASKMAGNLAEIRNALGGGHGRSRKPYVRAEEVDLALDGALTWVRWVLRRVALFAEGRPDQLIRDLVGSDTAHSQNFTKGLLARRLESASLQELDPKWQRALGVAVGQRSASGTFVVARDGFEPALDSADLAEWPGPYRLGLAQGCLFDRFEQPTIRPSTIVAAMGAVAPVEEDAVPELDHLVTRITRHFDTSREDQAEVQKAVREIGSIKARASAAAQPALGRLLENLTV